ncbi:hypothetical protein ABZ686_27615 [Streptomyces sp. NPDC006992]|uniref:hypothetical protein n=1 Tax=unclassified Streptomyces TaxID=2593676 RepID=UPI0034056311
MTGSRVESTLASMGRALRAEERTFDEPAALRRIAEDAGLLPLRDLPAVAGQQLTVVVRWALEHPGAAAHLERLAEAIGEKKSYGDEQDDWMLLVRVSDLTEIDVDGAHLFACMLYLARHHESAQFWWQFAAGAGMRVAAFCLHLHHLGRGETPEAEHWLGTLKSMDTPETLDEEFLCGLRRFAAWEWRNGNPASGYVAALIDEVYRLATIDNADEMLVCRPDHELALRLNGCGSV